VDFKAFKKRKRIFNLSITMMLIYINNCGEGFKSVPITAQNQGSQVASPSPSPSQTPLLSPIATPMATPTATPLLRPQQPQHQK